MQTKLPLALLLVLFFNSLIISATINSTLLVFSAENSKQVYVAPRAFIEPATIKFDEKTIQIPIQLEQEIIEEIRRQVVEENLDLCAPSCDIAPLPLHQVRVNAKRDDSETLPYSLNTEWQSVESPLAISITCPSDCSTLSVNSLLEHLQLQFPLDADVKEQMEIVIFGSDIRKVTNTSTPVTDTIDESQLKLWTENILNMIEETKLPGMVLASETERKRLEELIQFILTSSTIPSENDTSTSLRFTLNTCVFQSNDDEAAIKTSVEIIHYDEMEAVPFSLKITGRNASEDSEWIEEEDIDIFIESDENENDSGEGWQEEEIDDMDEFVPMNLENSTKADLRTFTPFSSVPHSTTQKPSNTVNIPPRGTNLLY